MFGFSLWSHGYTFRGYPPAECLSQIDFCKIVDVLNENNVIPLVTIDEFSFVRLMLKEGLIDATFISTLRNLALTGKACFVYSGTCPTGPSLGAALQRSTSSGTTGPETAPGKFTGS